jgi:hypothetical protein
LIHDPSSVPVLIDSEISIAKTEIEYIEEILIKIRKRLFIGTEIVDPKVEETVRIIEHHLSKNDKVIVFSRFTSTTSFLVDRLTKLNKFPFGGFEGDWKQVINGGGIENISRESIAERFSLGEFPVIICSDAASEGLNLQTANVVINVDVPWNPARILQRFGRIDRFGQKKSELYFYNLFYPDTIEDRMYSRLHSRNSEFRELLGTTPDITSKGHLRDLHLVIDDDKLSYKNTMLKLNITDNIRSHEIILDRLKVISEFKVSEKSIIYSERIYDYSTSEMEPLYLDLNHPIFTQLETNQNLLDISGLYNGKGDLLFICLINHEKAYPLIGLADLLDHFILRKWLNQTIPNDGISFHSPESELTDFLKRKSNQLINHNKIIFNFPLENSLYNGLYFEQL